MRQVAPLRPTPVAPLPQPLPPAPPDVRGVVLNAVLVAALAVGAAGVVSRFAPNWQPWVMALACALVALEAGIIHHVFRRERMWMHEIWRYLAPELLVMAVVMRVAATLTLGVATVRADAERWFLDPLSIFDAPFILALVLGVIVGTATHRTLQNLRDLAPRASDGQPDQLSTYRVTLALADERADALRQLNGRLVTGGVLMLILLTAESINLEQMGAAGRPVALSSAVAALAYLVAAFLLYSRARLALLRTSWRNEGMVVADGVERRWGVSGLILVAGVALAALLLPRTYGLGLLDTFRAGLGMLTYALAVIGYMLIWVISLIALVPAWILTTLFPGTQTAPVAAPPVPPLDVPPPPASLFTDPNPFAALIFWLCMAALVVHACRMILQRNPQIVRALLAFAPLRWLFGLLHALWQDTRSWVAAVAERVSDALRQPVAAARPPRVRLGGLTPRALVRYCYRSLLERAAQSGFWRRPGQTPLEYQQMLERELPESRADLSALTEAYIAARYAPQDPDPATARQVVRPWTRLLRRLRRNTRDSDN